MSTLPLTSVGAWQLQPKVAQIQHSNLPTRPDIYTFRFFDYKFPEYSYAQKHRLTQVIRVTLLNQKWTLMANIADIFTLIRHQETDEKFNAKGRDRPYMRSKNNSSHTTDQGQCGNYNLKSHWRCYNMSRMNLSGYVGNVSYMLLNVHYCVLFSSRIGVRISWLVSYYAHVFVRLRL